MSPPIINHHHHDGGDWDDGHVILNKARECAFGSDEVLALDAPVFLNKLLELVSDCSSGKRLGEDVCDITGDEDGSLVEIVTQLRVKADSADAIRRKLLLHNVGLMVSMAGAILASTLVWTMQQQQQSQQSVWPVAAVLGSTITSATTPFTAQELQWAVRDGYLDTLIMHWLRHGGL